jgi:hypothetical protein
MPTRCWSPAFILRFISAKTDNILCIVWHQILEVFSASAANSRLHFAFSCMAFLKTSPAFCHRRDAAARWRARVVSQFEI